MSPTQAALLIGTAAVAIALLAVFDIIPASVAQMVPLAVVPFVIWRGCCCSLRQQGRGA